jgi:mannan endo-1,4-beta-mannosidase
MSPQHAAAQAPRRRPAPSIFGRAARTSIALVLFAGCAQSTVADEESDPSAVLIADEPVASGTDQKAALDPVPAADAGARLGPVDASTSAAPVDASSPSEPQPQVDAGPREAQLPPVADPKPQPPAVQESARAPSAAHYQVKDGLLYDGCGDEFVLRGVNHPTMYTDREGAALPEIARTGANTVRMFWYGSHGVAIDALEPALGKAVASGLLPVLEMHDSTCAWNLGPIVEQWTKPEAVALIKKHEKHLLVNIANEASPPNADEFVKGYKSAISRMREAGIHTPLVIDGGRCGRDYELLLARGRELLDFDPDHNVIFSTHLYDPLDAMQYASLFTRARAAKLPLIVGEFANKEPPGCGKPLDYGSLISEANKAGIGWLAWSWGDNDPTKAWNADCGEFDMTKTFAFDSLEGWGREVGVEHAASIQKTSKRPYSLTHGDSCEP